MQSITYIPIDRIFPHPDNPRRDLGNLEELTGSIKAKGILQNLTVVPYGLDACDGEWFRVVIGHRRYAAAKLAGLTEVPCVVADMTEQEQFETMMIENIQRSDLTTYEQAEGFQTMLDMGGTVNEVAEKTGFSETTIRNRVKLLKLDQKKFQKAEERGGTLQDYLKLNEIIDPELRNKVLDAIGTPDFANKLKNAKAEEEYKAYIENLLKELQEADWCRELKDDERSDFIYYKNFSKYSMNKLERPENADTMQYVYAKSGNDITLYKERVVNETVDPIEEARNRLAGELNAIANQMDEIAQIHRELREDFVKNFSATKKYEGEIAAFAASAIVHMSNSHYYGNSMNLDLLGSLLNVPVSRETGCSNHSLDAEGWAENLASHPQFVLLCTAYTLLEKHGVSYHNRNWYYTLRVTIPEPKETTETADLIYAGLKSLGYEMSEEEIQMQEGTHPLYKKAQELVEAFKKEMAEDNGEQR